MDLKEAAILGDAARDHWYYVGKARALDSLLGRRRAGEVLDVGAGTGVFARHLLETGRAESATCVDTGYPDDRREEVAGRSLRFVRVHDSNAADLVLFMDVLEHVADDAALLRQYADPLPSGARIVVTVPAFRMLWSGHDVFLEHYRRYRLSEVEALARRCGLAVVTGRYFYGLLFPVAAALRLVDRLRLARGAEAKSQLAPAPAWLNRLLIAVHAVEARTLFRVNRVAGLSVVCLLRKP